MKIVSPPNPAANTAVSFTFGMNAPWRLACIMATLDNLDIAAERLDLEIDFGTGTLRLQTATECPPSTEHSCIFAHGLTANTAAPTTAQGVLMTGLPHFTFDRPITVTLDASTNGARSFEIRDVVAFWYQLGTGSRAT